MKPKLFNLGVSIQRLIMSTCLLSLYPHQLSDCNHSLEQNYFEAKELFAKAMERLNEIPEGAEAELIEKHKDEIVSVTSDLMKAFLLDEKACQINQRILKLAEQYEMYVQTHNPEGTSTATVDSEEEGAESQTTIYTRDSVVFGKSL